MRTKVLPLLALLMLALPVQAAEWPQFHADERHSGSVATDFTAPTERWWSASTGGPIEGNPVVSDGRVFVGSNDGKLYAFDAISGSPLWTFDAGSPISTTPALSGGVLYLVSNDGKLSAIDAVTGQLRKSASHGNPDPGSARTSPAIHEGRVYVGTESGNLIAYNLETLTKDWEFQPSQEQVSYVSGYSGSGNSTTPIVSCAGSQYAGKPIESSPAVFKNAVFFGSDVHSLFAVKEFGLGGAQAGKTEGVWLTNTSATSGTPDAKGGAPCHQAFYPAVGDVIRSSPVIDELNNLVIVASYDNYIRAYDVDGGLVWDTGQSGTEDTPCLGADATDPPDSLNLTSVCRPVWEFKVTDAQGRDSRIISTPAVDKGRVFFGSFNNKFYCLETYRDSDNVRRVREVWNKTTGGAIWSSPAVSNGLVAFGSDDQTVYVVQASNGVEKFHARTGDNVRSSPAIWTGGVVGAPITGGVVYVGARDGILYAFGAQKPALPDLKVANITIPDPLLVNSDATVNVTIANQGNSSSPATNMTIFIDGTLASTQPVIALGAGEKAYVEYVWHVPASNHSIIASVDPGFIVREFDRSNNQLKIETPQASNPPPPPPPPKPATAPSQEEKGAPGFEPLLLAGAALGAAFLARRRRG